MSDGVEVKKASSAKEFVDELRRSNQHWWENTTDGLGDSNSGIHNPKLAVVRPTIRDNPYLAAQSGLFTTLAASGVYFMKNNGQRPDLEEFVRKAQSKDVVLKKLTLPFIHVPDLMKILWRERLSRAVLMPSMDNVAKDVTQRWLQA